MTPRRRAKLNGRHPPVVSADGGRNTSGSGGEKVHKAFDAARKKVTKLRREEKSANTEERKRAKEVKGELRATRPVLGIQGDEKKPSRTAN